MNAVISNKTAIHILKRNFCNSAIFKQTVNYKSSIIFKSCNINKRLSPFLQSKKFSNKLLLRGSIPTGFKFQTRAISNEAPISNATDEVSKASVPDLSAAEESAAVINSNLPDFIKNISDWKIVELAQQSLLKVHELSGLPWWASIALTAFIARTTITLPFSIISVIINLLLTVSNNFNTNQLLSENFSVFRCTTQLNYE